MGDVQVHTLGHASGADGGGQNALGTVHGVDLVAGLVGHAGLKGLIARFHQHLLCIAGALALGLALVQEGLVALAEGICLFKGIGCAVRCQRRFVEQLVGQLLALGLFLAHLSSLDFHAGIQRLIFSGTYV